MRVHPEILSHMLYWTLFRPAGRSPDTPSRFAGLQKGSYNLQSPRTFPQKLQSSGVRDATSSQWWQTRSAIADPEPPPLDLVLYGPECGLFDETLQDAVKNHVMQDTIRQVHPTYSVHTPTSIISSLTPDDEGGQNDSIESIVWQTGGPLPRTSQTPSFGPAFQGWVYSTSLGTSTFHRGTARLPEPHF